MRDHQTRIAAMLAVVAAGALCTACYPTSNCDSITCYDTVATAHDSTVSFATFSTFSLPGWPDGGIPEFIPDGGTGQMVNHSFDPFILQTIATNFTNLGYTLVPTDTEPPPSFTVLVGVNASTYLFYYYPWYYYWGIYYPPGYPWYGYPWTPYPIYSAFDVGTLLINMTAPENGHVVPDGGPELDGVWVASIRGVLGSQGQYTPAQIQNRLQTRIDQAFIQSPYLTR
jgi:hypothetical protein